MTARRTVTLRYMTEFACIGDKCEESCCGGVWNIGIDRAHFVALEKLLTPREMEDGFKIVPQDAEVASVHARIKKDPHDDCVFLDHGWCSIHKRFGADALPNTCAQYPRRTSAVGDRIEMVATVSCPEVARRLLLRDDAIDIVPIDPEKVPRAELAQIAPPAGAAKGWAAVLDQIRGTLYATFLRPYPMASRMFFLAFFADQVGKFLEQKSPTVDTDKLALEMLRMETSEVHDALHERRIAADLPGGLAFAVIVRVLGSRLVHACSPGFRKLFTDAMTSFAGEGLIGEGDERTVDPGALALAWPKRREREALFGDRLDLYFRNYGMNWVMRDWFIWAPDLTTHVQRFLTRVAILRFLVLGHPGLDAAAAIDDPKARRERLDAIAVEVFYSFSRAMEHSEQLVSAATDELLRDKPALTAAAYLVAV